MLGPIIGAASSLIGGIMGQNAQKEAAAAQERMAAQNIALQKEFAQSGIQWKVEDAKKAGVHPLYALGANTTSFSPVSIGSPSGSPLGQGIAAAGQDLSRAMAATSSSTTRMLSGLTVERSMLENELLRTQIAKIRQQQIGPPIPSANPSALDALFLGQGDAAKGINFAELTKIKPHEVTPGFPGREYQEPTQMPSIGYTKTPTGYMPVPSKDFKDRAEDMGFLPHVWFYQNYVLPNLGMNQVPPPIAAEPGHQWQWAPGYQEYQQRRKVHGNPFFWMLPGKGY